MKKIILTSCVALLAIGANAQKGSWYLGGNVGFNSTTQKTDVGATTITGATVSSWTFSPEIGTFLTDNIQLGIGLTNIGNIYKNNDSFNTVSSNTKFGGTLYSRYFFGKGNFRPFLGVNVSVLPGVMSTKTTIGGTTRTVSNNTFDFGANLNAGFAYSLSNKVAVVGSFGALGFSSSTVNVGTTKLISNNFGLDAGTLGNRFTIGVYVTICNPKASFKEIVSED